MFICRLGEKLGFKMAHYEIDGPYIRSEDFTEGAKVNFELVRSLVDDNDDYQVCFNTLREISLKLAWEYLSLISMDTIVLEK